MTAPLKAYGADSSFPQPSEYVHPRQVWGVYVAGLTPHVWSAAEVRALSTAGIRAAMPIVVPPQTWPWLAVGSAGAIEAFQQRQPGAAPPEPGSLAQLQADGELTTLRELISQAQAWGVPAGCPLMLDIEESLAELVGTNLASLWSTWFHLCEEAHYFPWAYSSGWALHEAGRCFKMLADYPDPTPLEPSVPAFFDGWQYAGNFAGGRIDLDVYNLPRTFMATDGSGPIALGGPPPHTGPTMADLAHDLTNCQASIALATRTVEAMS